MKRYIKELVADVRREINEEIKKGRIPADELEYLEKWHGWFEKDCENGLFTDRDAVSAILVTWDKLKDLQWIYS